jgi:phosphatidylethanolamine-binding protein (PEBP) family uncharacterized protein
MTVQGTGDERLLVLCVRSASTWVIPALALVVVAGLAGCGGGSSDATSVSGPVTAGGEASGSAKFNGAEKSIPTSKAGDASEENRPANDAGPGAGRQGVKIVPPQGPREQSPTPKEIAQATVASMTLASPSLPTGTGGVAPLSSAYTCDGKDSWPALSWQGVPPGAAELALFAMNVQPVEGKLFFDWAVAGIDPALTGIEASSLPQGVVVGGNSLGKRGYSICPSPGSQETYMFALYALPKRLSPERGFDPSAFRQQVLAISGNAGFLPVSYGRG